MPAIGLKQCDLANPLPPRQHLVTVAMPAIGLKQCDADQFGGKVAVAMPAIGLKQCDSDLADDRAKVGGVAMPAIGLKQCDLAVHLANL